MLLNSGTYARSQRMPYFYVNHSFCQRQYGLCIRMYFSCPVDGKARLYLYPSAPKEKSPGLKSDSAPRIVIYKLSNICLPPNLYIILTVSPTQTCIPPLFHSPSLSPPLLPATSTLPLLLLTTPPTHSMHNPASPVRTLFTTATPIPNAPMPALSKTLAAVSKPLARTICSSE